MKMIKKMIKIMIHLSDRPCMMQRWVRKLKKFAKTGCMEYIFNNLMYFKTSDIFFKRSTARNIF